MGKVSHLSNAQRQIDSPVNRKFCAEYESHRLNRDCEGDSIECFRL